MATQTLRTVSTPAARKHEAPPAPTITSRVRGKKRQDGLRLGFDALEDRVVLSTTTMSSAAALQMARGMLAEYRGGGNEPVAAPMSARVSLASQREVKTVRECAPPPSCDPPPSCTTTMTVGDPVRRRCESVPVFNPNKNCYPTPNCEPQCEVRPALEKAQRGNSKPSMESKQRADTRSTAETKQRCELRPVCEVKQVCDVKQEREAKSTRGGKQACNPPTNGEGRQNRDSKQVCETRQLCETPPRCNDNVPVRTASASSSKSNYCNTVPGVRNGQQCENRQNDCQQNDCQQNEAKQNSRQQCDVTVAEKVAKAVDKCFGDTRFVSQVSRSR